MIGVEYVMKRVIAGTLSRSHALDKIAKSLSEDTQFEGCEVVVNKDHNCVDIFFPDGTMNQVYPKSDTAYPCKRARYVYVGPNMGDYCKQYYNTHRRAWIAEPDIIKHVDHIQPSGTATS